MSYPGGKAGSGVYQRIISQMPVHQHYLELFAGHGAIASIKRRAPGRNVISDIDAGVIAWWKKRRPTTPHLTLLQRNALRILASDPALRDPKALVYLDPPYLLSVRTRLIYPREFATVEQHTELLKAARRCKCMVMISGYRSDLYERMLHDWRHISYNTTTRWGAPRREYLWMNFPPPVELHDVRFAGDNYRERTRIKRKRDRWQTRFAGMPAIERQVIREALDAVEVG